MQVSATWHWEPRLTANKGYRDIGGGKTERHPHAWSIAEPGDLMKWILSGK